MTGIKVTWNQVNIISLCIVDPERHTVFSWALNPLWIMDPHGVEPQVLLQLVQPIDRPGRFGFDTLKYVFK